MNDEELFDGLSIGSVEDIADANIIDLHHDAYVVAKKMRADIDLGALIKCASLLGNIQHEIWRRLNVIWKFDADEDNAVDAISCGAPFPFGDTVYEMAGKTGPENED